MGLCGPSWMGTFTKKGVGGAKSHKKVLLTQKYVTLYFYVNMCFKSLSKIMSFSSPLRITYELFQAPKIYKIAVTMINQCF
jgi:hypothetical protein